MIHLHHQFELPVSSAALAANQDGDNPHSPNVKTLAELKSTFTSMLATLTEMRVQQQQMENEWVQKSVQLALQIARAILCDDAESSTEKLEARLAELMAQNQDHKPIEIRLNPAELKAIEALEIQSKESADIRLVADSDTAKGDFLFMMDDQVVMQNRQWQLKEIELKLLEAFSNE